MTSCPRWPRGAIRSRPPPRPRPHQPHLDGLLKIAADLQWVIRCHRLRRTTQSRRSDRYRGRHRRTQPRRHARADNLTADRPQPDMHRLTASVIAASSFPAPITSRRVYRKRADGASGRGPHCIVLGAPARPALSLGRTSGRRRSPLRNLDLAPVKAYNPLRVPGRFPAPNRRHFRET